MYSPLSHSKRSRCKPISFINIRTNDGDAGNAGRGDGAGYIGNGGGENFGYGADGFSGGTDKYSAPAVAAGVEDSWGDGEGGDSGW